MQYSKSIVERLQLGCLVLILIVLPALAGSMLSKRCYTFAYQITTFLSQSIDEAIVEFYSPDYYTSSSIADAHQRQIFVSQLTPKSYIVQGVGAEYSIQEMWIDKVVKITYQGSYPNRRAQIVPLGGYRLTIRFNRSIPHKHTIVCNDIKINGWQDDTIRSAEIQTPLPSVVDCTVMRSEL